MEGIALALSIIVIIAVIILSIIVFINVSNLSKAMKNLETHYTQLQARQNDSETILDNDIKTLQRNLSTTGSNVVTLSSDLRTSHSNVSRDIVTLNNVTSSNTLALRASTSNDLNTLARAQLQLSANVTNMPNTYVRHQDIRESSYPALRGERVIVGSQYAMSNSGGLFTLHNGNTTLYSVNPTTRELAVQGPVSSTANITAKDNICIQNSCMNKQSWDLLVQSFSVNI